MQHLRLPQSTRESRAFKSLQFATPLERKMIQLRICVLVVLILAVIDSGIDAQKIEMIEVSDAMVNMAVRNPRIIGRQVDCMLDRKECDNMGEKLKKAAPYLLVGKCPGCSAKQQNQANKVLTAVNKFFPEDYKALHKKYVKKDSQKKPSQSPKTPSQGQKTPSVVKKPASPSQGQKSPVSQTQKTQNQRPASPNQIRPSAPRRTPAGRSGK